MTPESDIKDGIDLMKSKFDIGTDRLLSTLDGDVYSQNVKIGHRAWLDMGSEDYQQSTDQQKAAAFQAATKIGNWSKDRLKQVMLKNYHHLRESVLDTTIKSLEKLAELHPVEVVENPVESKAYNEILSKVVVRRAEPNEPDTTQAETCTTP